METARAETPSEFGIGGESEMATTTEALTDEELAKLRADQSDRMLRPPLEVDPKPRFSRTVRHLERVGPDRMHVLTLSAELARSRLKRRGRPARARASALVVDLDVEIGPHSGRLRHAAIAHAPSEEEPCR